MELEISSDYACGIGENRPHACLTVRSRNAMAKDASASGQSSATAAYAIVVQ